MTAHEIHALSGAYAMDALDDLERARFEEHLAVCAECRAEVLSLQDATLLLSELSSVAPPAAMRAKVLADIKKVRPLPPTVVAIERRRPRRWSNLVAAAAVLGVLGGSAFMAQDLISDDRTTQAPPSADAVIDRVLTAADVKHVTAKMPGGVSATVSISRSADRAVLVTRSMPDAPKDHIYQVWFQKGDKMVAAGVMPDGGNNKLLLDGDLAGASAVGVTIEPERGANDPAPEEPTTAPVALMDFEQAT